MAKQNKHKITKAAATKYKLVIDEWFNNQFNGKQAYLKYYPTVKDATASTNFCKVQEMPVIKEYIQEKQEAASLIVKTTHEGILKELNNYIESDITQTIELTPDEIKELPIEVRRLVTSFKATSRNIYNSKGDIIETIKTVELKFVDKLRAMIEVAKHIGFYEVDNKQKASVVQVLTSSEAHTTIVQNILDGK